MEMNFANRLGKDEDSIFKTLNFRKKELVSQGKKIFDMSIGTPNFEPAHHVISALIEASGIPENYKYALADLPELKESVVSHYKKHFNVSLTEKSVMSVNGSQEGLAHICFTLCNPGDIVLAPNPGYPIFRDGPILAGAQIYHYPLVKDKGYIADLWKISENIAYQAKVIIVSYPMNPVAVTAPDEFYVELIKFAQKYNIIVIHDNAYTDISFNKRKSKSFLEFQGAMSVGVELFSLSKSYNLAGARISFVVGNDEIIKKYKNLRSYIDYGIFRPIQYAAIAALNGPQDEVEKQCEIYEKRSCKLCQGLREMGWKVDNPTGSIFVWAPVPLRSKNSIQFVNLLMESTGIICTPGSCFGSLGEGYVRFSLVLNDHEIEDALHSLKSSKILDVE